MANTNAEQIALLERLVAEAFGDGARVSMIRDYDFDGTVMRSTVDVTISMSSDVFRKAITRHVLRGRDSTMAMVPPTPNERKALDLMRAVSAIGVPFINAAMPETSATLVEIVKRDDERRELLDAEETFRTEPKR